MPKTWVTIKGKRIAVSDVTTKDRPYFKSKNYHHLGASLLRNEIANHQRSITELNKMPVSKYTNKDIVHHQKHLTSKRKEVLHRQSMDKKHNLRW